MVFFFFSFKLLIYFLTWIEIKVEKEKGNEKEKSERFNDAMTIASLKVCGINLLINTIFIYLFHKLLILNNNKLDEKERQ